MKILIHSNAPWVPTGYGTQTALLLRQLTSLGHEPAVSAFWGLRGAPVVWNGHTVYPGGQAEYGQDVMIPHAQHFGADLVITLMDFWKMAPVASALRRYTDQSGLKLAAWLPIDCTPLSHGDRDTLTASGAIPIAMSRHGEVELRSAGFDPVYIPHSIDTTLFRPLDRSLIREELDLTDRYVVGLNAANKDAIRKAFPEQFAAFAQFAKTRDDAVLMVHTDPVGPGGHRLDVMASDMGIADRVIFSDSYAQTAGHIDIADMAHWYNACDIVTNCSYGEGFGLPILEARACVVPVVATGNSAMTELSPATVRSEPFWNPYHRAWWGRPNHADMVYAYGNPSPIDEGERWIAEQYELNAVRVGYWKPFLDSLTGDSDG